MLKENREKLHKIVTQQRHLREQVEAIWEQEEIRNTQSVRGHQYSTEEAEMANAEEKDLEWTSNLMDNVLDKLYETLEVDPQSPKYVDSENIGREEWMIRECRLIEQKVREGNTDLARQLKQIYSELGPYLEPEEINWLNGQVATKEQNK